MSSNNRKKIWVLTDLFFPEETSTSFILTKLVNVFSEKHDVNVICGSQIYDIGHNKQTNFTLKDTINVIRIPGFRGNKNSIIFRIYRYYFLTRKICKVLKKRVNNTDTVFCVTNPVFLITNVSKMKKKLNFTFWILVHDLFPENTIPTGLLNSNSIIYTMLKHRFDNAYCSADRLISIGSDMKEVLEKKIGTSKNNQCIETITNWAEIDIIRPREKKENLDKVVILFAGNLGRVQGLSKLMDLIIQIDNQSLLFVFQGTGASSGIIKDAISKYNLKNVEVKPGFSRNSQSEILSNCDIGLVSLDDSMYGLGVPSKAYNIMAAGKPILFFGHEKSEISIMIKENNIGYSFSLYDSENILAFFNTLSIASNNLLSEMGHRARKLAEDKYSEKFVLSKYRELL